MVTTLAKIKRQRARNMNSREVIVLRKENSLDRQFKSKYRQSKPLSISEQMIDIVT